MTIGTTMVPTQFQFDQVTLTARGVRMIAALRETSTNTKSYSAYDQDYGACLNVWLTHVQYQINDEVLIVLQQQVEDLRTTLHNASITTMSNQTRALNLHCDVVIQVRSPVTTHNVFQYVEGPFDTPEERAALVDYLRSTRCPMFQDVYEIQVILPEQEESVLPKDEEEQHEISVSGLIAGILFVIMAVFLFSFTFVWSRQARTNRGNRNMSAVIFDDVDGLFRNSQINVITNLSEICLNSANNEVSSLGEPTEYLASYSIQCSREERSLSEAAATSGSSTNNDDPDLQMDIPSTHSKNSKGNSFEFLRKSDCVFEI
jgi:hypothetical protein